MIRGMRWHTYRRAIGWHGGKGVFREIGAGVIGYLAGLPLFAMGLGITFALVGLVTILREAARTGRPAPAHQPDLRSGDERQPGRAGDGLPARHRVGAAVRGIDLPRGALPAHARAGRDCGAPSASALIFGLCHQYGPVLVFPVVLLGVNFALAPRVAREPDRAHHGPRAAQRHRGDHGVQRDPADQLG